MLYGQVYRLFRETYSEVAWHGRCIDSEPLIVLPVSNWLIPR